MKTRKTTRDASGQPVANNPDSKTESSIKAAVAALRQAQEHLVVFARERAQRQLSISALSSIGAELQGILHRLSAYDRD